jgi:hypothetical protein
MIEKVCIDLIEALSFPLDHRQLGSPLLGVPARAAKQFRAVRAHPARAVHCGRRAVARHGAAVGRFFLIVR